MGMASVDYMSGTVNMSAQVYMVHQPNNHHCFCMIPYTHQQDIEHKELPDKSDLKDKVAVEYVFHKLLLLLQNPPTESLQNTQVTDQLVQVPDLLEMVVDMRDKMAAFPVHGHILDLVE